MPSDGLDQIPVNFGLRLQDIPGAHGVAPTGQLWKIVVLNQSVAGYDADGIVAPQVFGRENWEEIICEGTVGTDGALSIDGSKQLDIYSRISTRPGKVWLVTALSAMELRVAGWSTGAASANTKRIVDALNFTQDGRSLDALRDAIISEVARTDASVSSAAMLNNKIIV